MYQIHIFYRGLNPNFQAAECSRCSWVMTMIVISINWEIVATMFFFHGTAIPVVRLFLGNPWPILDGAWAQSKSNESLHELFVFHVEARALRISCLDQVEPGSDVGVRFQGKPMAIFQGNHPTKPLASRENTASLTGAMAGAIWKLPIQWDGVGLEQKHISEIVIG